MQNKGIGFAIVRQLALQYPKSPLNGGPLLVYLTARDEKSGKDAVASLETDEALRQAKALQSDGGLTSIRFHRLDISDSASIAAFAEHLSKVWTIVLVHHWHTPGCCLSRRD